MKKLLSSVSSAALVLCLTLQLAHAMRVPEAQGGEDQCNLAYHHMIFADISSNNRRFSCDCQVRYHVTVVFRV